MENSTRNFHAHGGNEWVVGGKLTFLPGAVVEGAEGLFDLPVGTAPSCPTRRPAQQAPSRASRRTSTPS